MTELQRHRMRARLTVGALAKMANVHTDTIRNAERGNATLTDASLFKLADALGIDPIDLRESDGRHPKAVA